MADNKKLSKKVDKMKNQKIKPVEIKNTNYSPDQIPAKLTLGILCLCLSIVHIVVAFRPSGAVPLFYRPVLGAGDPAQRKARHALLIRHWCCGYFQLHDAVFHPRYRLFRLLRCH